MIQKTPQPLGAGANRLEMFVPQTCQDSCLQIDGLRVKLLQALATRGWGRDMALSIVCQLHCLDQLIQESETFLVRRISQFGAFLW